MLDDSGFHFEHTFELTPDIYAEIHEVMPRKYRWLRRTGALIVGIAFLQSPYTLVIGIALLGLLLVAVFIPKFLPKTARRTFEFSDHLHGPITYGVSDTHVWSHGALFEQRCAWENVAVFEERGDWLRLHPQSLNQLYFSISALKDASVYEQVASLASDRATRYASRFTNAV